MSENRKRLEVSVEPSVMGSQAVQPNVPKLPKATVQLLQPQGLAMPVNPVGRGAFVGKFVVFSPVGNQLTQPIDSITEAENYARTLAASGKPAVVMAVVAQFP